MTEFTARPSTQVRVVDDPATPHRPFLPGMGKSWLMPLYDPFTRLTGANRLRAGLIERAGITAGQQVLDVGCGSGDLLMSVASAVPGAALTGLDPDGIALGRAARKAAAAGIGITLIRGYADDLPLEDAFFDQVVSTLAVHHLDDEARIKFAGEAFRVLKPGGRVTILDFGGATGDHPHGPAGHLTAMIDTLMRKSPRMQPALGDGLPDLLRPAGFTDAAEIAHRQSFIGPLTIVQGTR